MIVAGTVEAPGPQRVRGAALEPRELLPAGFGTADERPARAQLRAQVARLERLLGVESILPRPPARVRRREAVVLDLEGLERVRDELVDRLRAARALGAARELDAEVHRRRLEAMRLAPGRHRWEQVRLSDLGLPGCGAYQVRPRLGLVGMLAGWWEVKLSSGCP